MGIFDRIKKLGGSNPEEKKRPAVTDWNSLESYDEASKVDPNLTRTDWMHEHAKYRKENGMPEMSYTDVLAGMGVGNPFKSKAQEDAEKKKVKRASMLNALGNVLINLWNVGRTKAGNPAMNLTGSDDRGRQRIEQMRAGQEKLANQNYAAYMDAWVRDKAQRDALAAEERKNKASAEIAAQQHQYALDELAAKQNTPYERYRADNEFWQAQYNKARAEGYPEVQAAEIASQRALADQRKAAAKKYRTGIGSSGSGRFHPGTSAYGSDGKIYVRSKVISDEEKRQLVDRYAKPVQAVDSKGNPVVDKKGNPVMKKLSTDDAFAMMMKNGDVPAPVLRSMGYILLDEAESGSGSGSLNWGDEDESTNEEETDW